MAPVAKAMTVVGVIGILPLLIATMECQGSLGKESAKVRAIGCLALVMEDGLRVRLSKISDLGRAAPRGRAS
jgi:hypothetical protein